MFLVGGYGCAGSLEIVSFVLEKWLLDTIFSPFKDISRKITQGINRLHLYE